MLERLPCSAGGQGQQPSILLRNLLSGKKKRKEYFDDL